MGGERPDRFTAGEDLVAIVQEAGWVPGPVWTGAENLTTGIRSPDRATRSESLHRLSYSGSLAVTYRPLLFIYLRRTY